MPLSRSVSAILARSRMAVPMHRPTAVAFGRGHRWEGSHWAGRLRSVTTLIEGCSMETETRDVLLGMVTWWGFHALLIWMGVRHFLARSVDGNFLLSDVFAGLLLVSCVLSLLRLSIGRIMLRLIVVVSISAIAVHVCTGTVLWGC